MIEYTMQREPECGDKGKGKGRENGRDKEGGGEKQRDLHLQKNDLEVKKIRSGQSLTPTGIFAPEHKPRPWASQNTAWVHSVR